MLTFLRNNCTLFADSRNIAKFIQKKAAAESNFSFPISRTAVKGEEGLFFATIKINNNVLIFEKDMSNIALMERYAGMLGCVMTVFIDDLRVETTIRDENGKYLKGTKLNNDVIYNKVYKDHETYRGNNIINKKPYVTVYIPLDNEDNAKCLLFMGISIESIEINTFIQSQQKLKK